MSLPLPSPQAQPQNGERECDEVAEHGHERERRQDECRAADEHRRPARSPPACERAADRRRRTERTEHAADPARDRAGPIREEPADDRPGNDRERQSDAYVAQHSEPEHAERRTEASADADPIPASHRIRVY